MTMTTTERERIIADLITVLLPRLSNAQIQRLHASAAAMVTRKETA